MKLIGLLITVLALMCLFGASIVSIDIFCMIGFVIVMIVGLGLNN